MLPGRFIDLVRARMLPSYLLADSARAGRLPRLAGAFALLVLGACGGGEPAPAAAFPAPAEPAAPAPAAAPSAQAGTGWIGVVVAGETVAISPDLQGRLSEVRVGVGDTVQRGQVLAVLDRNALEQELRMARASLAAARADAERLEIERAEAKVRYDRRTTLGELVSAEEVSESKLAYERAQASVRVSEARVTEAEARADRLEEMLGQTELRAPFDGTVTLRQADAGAVVGPSQPVLTLSSGSLRVRFAVPPGEAPSLEEGQRLTAVCCTPPQTAPLAIERIAPEIDLAAQMVVVEAIFAGGEPVPFRLGQDLRVFPPPSPAEPSAEMPPAVAAVESRPAP